MNWTAVFGFLAIASIIVSYFAVLLWCLDKAKREGRSLPIWAFVGINIIGVALLIGWATSE